jgi:hypothetical protein
MPRFRSHGQLDDPFIEDGDPAFTGLDQFSDPSLLVAGQLQLAENIRIEQGQIVSRGGLTKNYSAKNGKALIRFQDPVSVTEEMLLVDNESVIGLIGRSIQDDYESSLESWDQSDLYFTGRTVDQKFKTPYENYNEVIGIQSFDKVLLFSAGQRPKEWDGRVLYIEWDTQLTWDSEMTWLQDQEAILPSVFDLSEDSDTGILNSLACPNAGFATYFSNRLIVPYYEDSPTTVAFSDIFVNNNFMLENTFFCNKGSSDQTIGFASFMENQILVLNKESIFLINNVHALGENSTSYEITRQYGVAGTKSFAQNGSYLYFISSEGNIQVLVPSSDPAKGVGIAISKVTLDQEALSKPITPLINRVNIRELKRSIAFYHRNRVYFALPIDGKIYPNVICVYNSLYSQWESIDTFEDDIKILDINSLNDEIFILTEDGVYKYGEGETDDGTPINVKARTRDYIMQTRDIKKFIRGSLSYSTDQNTDIKISAITKSPDSKVLSKLIQDTEGKDDYTRFNIRQRGYSASIEMISNGGSSRFKSVAIEGIIGTGRGSATYAN